MSNLGNFPPEVLCIVTSYLTCWEIGHLWLMGSKMLSTKLSEGGVSDFDMNFDHRRFPEHPWPNLISSLRRLSHLSLSLHRNKNARFKLPLDLHPVTRDLHSLELTFGAPHMLPESSFEYLTTFPELHTITLSNVHPKSGYQLLKQMKALTDLSINIPNNTCDTIIEIGANLPSSLTALRLHSKENRYKQEKSGTTKTLSLPPQLRKFLISGIAGEVEINPIEEDTAAAAASDKPDAQKRCFPESLLHIQADQCLSDAILKAAAENMLPPNLEVLKFSEVPMGAYTPAATTTTMNILTNLPLSLHSFGMNDQLTPEQLAQLPPQLTYLKCSGLTGGLTVEKLPRNLVEFRSSHNALDLVNLIHFLPPKITELTCYNDSLKLIPLLPQNLTSLNCRLDPANFSLVPPTLTFLDIYVPNTQSEKLSPLPQSIKVLILGMHMYSPMDFLPQSLTTLDVRLLSDNLPEEPPEIDWSKHFARTLRTLSVSASPQILGNNWIQLLPTEHLTSFRLTGRHFPSSRQLNTADNILSSACFSSLGRHLKELTIPFNTIDLADFRFLPRSLEQLHINVPGLNLSENPEEVLDALPPHVGTFIMPGLSSHFISVAAKRGVATFTNETRTNEDS